MTDSGCDSLPARLTAIKTHADIIGRLWQGGGNGLFTPQDPGLALRWLVGPGSRAAFGTVACKSGDSAPEAIGLCRLRYALQGMYL